ncbi:helix-turn-helix domain-containing protein [Branchiibius cervicis]|uniref:Helix-turn-helix domain-containing protein n=1 Tax=Branchiibius cervicis TaxID=908252 RepID=A0ABW2ATX2_9MICO
MRPLRDRDAVRETAVGFLGQPSLEATARALFVHANTVRYRLGQFAEATGYDLTDVREAFVVRVAFAFAAWDER